MEDRFLWVAWDGCVDNSLILLGRVSINMFSVRHPGLLGNFSTDEIINKYNTTSSARMSYLSKWCNSKTCGWCEVSDVRGQIWRQKMLYIFFRKYTNRKCNFVQGCGVSPERTHSSLVPWSQNSWTWARPRDLNFSTMDCSLAVLVFSSSRISLLTYTWPTIT